MKRKIILGIGTSFLPIDLYKIEVMKNFPKLSIGIATFNGERTLKRCINSLLTQSFQDFEIIISDDNSTDQTVQIVEDLCKKHKNIKFFRQKGGLREFRQKKFILEKCDTPFIKFLDQDDYLDSSNYIEVSYLKLRQGYDLVFSNTSIEIYDENTLVERRDNIMFPYSKCQSGFDYAIASLSEASMIFYSFFSKSVLDKYFSHYFPSFISNAAYSEGVFGTDLVLNEKVLYLPEINSVSTESNYNNTSNLQSLELFEPYINYLKGMMNLGSQLSILQKFKYYYELFINVFPTLSRLTAVTMLNKLNFYKK